MSVNETLAKTNPWQSFSGLNLGYVDEQYDKFLEDPDTVDPTLRDLFDKWGRPKSIAENPFKVHPNPEYGAAENSFDLDQAVGAVRLAERIRTYGHLLAHVNPLGEHHIVETHLMDLAAFNLSPKKLKAIPSRVVWAEAPDEVRNALDVVNYLRDLYSRSLAYEFSHVQDLKEKKWLNEAIERKRFQSKMSDIEKRILLKQLGKVETFEHFLHKTFVGQKRFSIEGLDVLVPMLDKLIQCGVADGTKQIMISMAHRGRLSVLAHILGKPYEKIMAEFVHAPIKSMVPSEGSKGINYGWTGDVKYHLGAARSIEEGNKKYLLQYTGDGNAAQGPFQVKVTLANNPSHLEVVDPVIEGYARAAQDNREKEGYPDQDTEKAFTIMIHGDAAFPGEGVVAETFNLSRLKGFNTGGTIHIIANNQLGFTTDQEDGRSTAYASDLAKGFEVPIVHVNADDPEACLSAIRLAYQYRKTFRKDFLIDLCGYRRYGHNESDDPEATQPLLYHAIHNHPTVCSLYEKRLEDENVVNGEELKKYRKHLVDKLQLIYNKSREEQKKGLKETPFPKKLAEPLDHIQTKVPIDELKDLNRQLLDWPEELHVYPKLARILKRRETALNGGRKIDWGLGESLAFASILKDGTPIRFTGQDVERGTFAHRHAVLHDVDSGISYSPYHYLNGVRTSFDIRNSPLSETAVIGFEYGYNVFAPETLDIWEAQFGDFANVGQVMFDQFVTAGRAKWGQKSGLVILLPHGYEGMGPEHSSGRLERFLQLSAENNWVVANLTTPAQYFHILRRQASILNSDVVRPLVIMTPKSLLRHPKATSSPEDLSEGHFRSIVEEPLTGGDPAKVRRLALCSGKVAVDLEVEIAAGSANLEWLHILRVEELYPFPGETLKKFFGKYPGLREIVWLQEEPKNMGAWSYIEPRLRSILPAGIDLSYIGRPQRSSTATGEPEFHKQEQRRIISETLQKTLN
ncbi:2-oxoglutarate dehydrogenase E1 component [Sporolactobacillus sp. CQH2019]|uniref:2-oxoglutarate dehydrogenase E1 component n=1 Tax=Sporolactobacillus sp. CQH2019 TaxID=3023512 RepID=UPI00236884F0|nr:2-oxoglutarate dehydrogenase E1 component [Sporolactobacillus sp. CQH2019]MDD9149374.1 2-oxoglutarate dehydrogenase E1 component [Sporolactobacillus sp. CQH2019]